MSTPTAVILMAYGTPASAAEILPYYTDIRRGRPPTEEQLADLTRRYEAIGGLSPLAERTEAQRAMLQHKLDRRCPGAFRVSLGLKHAAPQIEATVAAAAGECERIVGLVLAPHFSTGSVGQYLSRLSQAAEESGIPTTGISSWATLPAFVRFLVDDLAERLRRMPADAHVLFTAHSLPQRIIDGGDHYPQQLAATAEAVAAALRLPVERWSIAWQSAGRTPEPWIGPDILAAIDALADRGVTGVVVCACGFVSDHLEVLYDLDVEAKAHAERRGLAFDRTACVNDDTATFDELAEMVIEAAGQ